MSQSELYSCFVHGDHAEEICPKCRVAPAQAAPAQAEVLRDALQSISDMLHGSWSNACTAMEVADKALAGWTGLRNPPSGVEAEAPRGDQNDEAVVRNVKYLLRAKLAESRNTEFRTALETVCINHNLGKNWRFPDGCVCTGCSLLRRIDHAAEVGLEARGDQPIDIERAEKWISENGYFNVSPQLLVKFYNDMQSKAQPNREGK